MADVDLKIVAVADVANAKAAVESLDDSVKKVTTTQAGATAEGLKGEAGLKALSAEISAAAAQSKGLAGGLGSTAGAAAGLGASFAAAALPISSFVIIAALLPDLFKKISDGSKSIAESLVNLVGGFDDEATVVQKAGESHEQYQARVERANDARENLRRAMTAMGNGLIQETSNLDHARLAWETHSAAIHGNWDAYQGLEQRLKQFGIVIPEALEKTREAAELFMLAYEGILNNRGAEAARRFAEDSKGALADILGGYQYWSEQAPPLLLKVKDALGVVTKAEQEAARESALAVKFLDQARAVDELLQRLPGYTAQLGSERAAILALRQEIENHIKGLEKLKTTNAEDEQLRLQKIAVLQNLLAAEGALTEGIAAEEAAVAKAKDKFAELSKELAENGKAFEANAKKIEEHRTTQIEASQATLNETTKNLAAEIQTVEASFKARTISASDYNVRINTLFAEQANAKKAAYEEQRAIDEKAKTDQDALAKKWGETKTAIGKELGEIGRLFEEAQKATDIFVRKQGESATALTLSGGAATTAAEGHATAEGKLATAAGAAATNFAELATKMGVAAGATVPLVTAIGNVTTALGAMRIAADAAAEALDRVTEGGPGGAGPSAAPSGSISV